MKREEMRCLNFDRELRKKLVDASKRPVFFWEEENHYNSTIAAAYFAYMSSDGFITVRKRDNVLISRTLARNGCNLVAL